MHATAPNAALPGLSLVVTCYRQEPYIRTCLESCFAQTYEGPMEVVIVDDCSTDNSLAEIERAVADFGQGRDVTIVRNATNLGVSGATDAGWAAAKHDWFIMVDGDDIQLPERCARTAALIARHPDVDMIALSARDMSMDGSLRGSCTSYASEPYDSLPEELCLRSGAELAANYFHEDAQPTFAAYGCSMAISRRLYARWGALQPDPAVRAGFQDRIWQWRAILSTPILGSKQLACHYRSHSGNIYNREKKPGLRGMMEAERNSCRYHRGEATSQRSLLRDLERAMAEDGLSCWPREQLERAGHSLAAQLESLELKADWWDIPWRERLRRTMGTRKFRRWTWPRLLPLPLACLLNRLLGRKKS